MHSYAFREAHYTPGCEVIKHSTNWRLQGKSSRLRICKNWFNRTRSVRDTNWCERNSWLCGSRVSADKLPDSQEWCVLLRHLAPGNPIRSSSYWGEQRRKRKDYRAMGMSLLSFLMFILFQLLLSCLSYSLLVSSVMNRVCCSRFLFSGTP